MKDALISRYKEVDVQIHDCGPMDVVCPDCDVRYARAEVPANSRGRYLKCCKLGTCISDVVPDLLLIFRRLYTDQIAEARHFRFVIR